MKLNKLETPQLCAVSRWFVDTLVPCGKTAYWSVDETPVCIDDIRNMAGMNSDNAAFFAPALASEQEVSHV